MASTEKNRRSTFDWRISFRLSTVFLGCLFAAITFAGLTTLLMLTFPDRQLLADAGATPLQIGLTLGGFGALLIFLVGPATAYLVGYLLRDVGNQSLHVVAFGVAGAAVGAMSTTNTFGWDAASIFAALLGISAMIARALVSPYAQR